MITEHDGEREKADSGGSSERLEDLRLIRCPAIGSSTTSASWIATPTSIKTAIPPELMEMNKVLRLVKLGRYSTFGAKIASYSFTDT